MAADIKFCNPDELGAPKYRRALVLTRGHVLLTLTRLPSRTEVRRRLSDAGGEADIVRVCRDVRF